MKISEKLKNLSRKQIIWSAAAGIVLLAAVLVISVHIHMQAQAENLAAEIAEMLSVPGKIELKVLESGTQNARMACTIYDEHGGEAFVSEDIYIRYSPWRINAGQLKEIVIEKGALTVYPDPENPVPALSVLREKLLSLDSGGDVNKALGFRARRLEYKGDVVLVDHDGMKWIFRSDAVLYPDPDADWNLIRWKTEGQWKDAADGRDDEEWPGGGSWNLTGTYDAGKHKLDMTGNASCFAVIFLPDDIQHFNAIPAVVEPSADHHDFELRECVLDLTKDTVWDQLQAFRADFHESELEYLIFGFTDGYIVYDASRKIFDGSAVLNYEGSNEWEPYRLPVKIQLKRDDAGAVELTMETEQDESTVGKPLHMAENVLYVNPHVVFTAKSPAAGQWELQKEIQADRVVSEGEQVHEGSWYTRSFSAGATHGKSVCKGDSWDYHELFVFDSMNWKSWFFTLSAPEVRDDNSEITLNNGYFTLNGTPLTIDKFAVSGCAPQCRLTLGDIRWKGVSIGTGKGHRDLPEDDSKQEPAHEQLKVEHFYFDVALFRQPGELNVTVSEIENVKQQLDFELDFAQRKIAGTQTWMELLVPDLYGIRIDGLAAYKIKGSLADNSWNMSSRFTLYNGLVTLPQAGIEAKDVFCDLQCIFRDGRWVTAPGQTITFTSLKIANLDFGQGSLVFRVDADGSFRIESFRAEWCGGIVTLDPCSPELDKTLLNMHCMDLDLAQFLTQTGFGRFTGQGKVSGNLPFRIAKNGVIFENAVLTSEAGAESGILQGTLNEKAIVRRALDKDSPDISFTCEALQHMSYRWARVMLNSGLDGSPAMTLQFNATPLKELKYTIDRKNNRILRSDVPQRISGGLILKLSNIRLDTSGFKKAVRVFAP